MRTRAILTTLTLGLAFAGCAGPGDSQRLLRSAVDERQPSLTTCYGDALERDSTMEGFVRARLHVERASGLVQNVEILESNLGDAALQACMTSALSGIRLAEAPGVNLTVDYDFELVRDSVGGPQVAQQ
jgi:hypothetical protein